MMLNSGVGRTPLSVQVFSLPLIFDEPYSEVAEERQMRDYRGRAALQGRVKERAMSAGFSPVVAFAPRSCESMM